MTKPSFAVFFDFGDTLAVPVLNAEGGLGALEPLPFVLDVLGKLTTICRLGVISNTGTATLQTMQSVLATSGLAEFFEPALLLFSSVEGMDKTQRSFFELASHRAGIPAAHCIYVGEDATERLVAVAAGLKVSFHPLHVFHVLQQLSKH